MPPSSYQWVHEARSVLRQHETDFYTVEPRRYWTDFLFTLVCAYALGWFYLNSPFGSWQQLALYPPTVYFLYCLISLIHEVAHLPRSGMNWFLAAWNVLAGVMLLTPSPLYAGQHRQHHSAQRYGTAHDPEYIINSFEPGNAASLLRYLGLILVMPILGLLRWLLVPVTYLHPQLREWTLRHATSLTFDFTYERRWSDEELRWLLPLEWLCWLRATAIPAAILVGGVDWTRLITLYSLAIGTLALNQLRLLADHHFDSGGRRLEIPEQARDSCNVVGRDLLTNLLFPFALRYHGLHHLFPAIPYHHLPVAHQLLKERLPSDSPYHLLDAPSWWAVASRTLFDPREKALEEPVGRDGVAASV